MIRSVLIAQGAFGDIYEPAWVRALNELGVQARLFASHDHTLPGPLGRLERRLLWGVGIRRIQQRLLALVEEQRPDVLLLYQGHYFPATLVQQLRQYTFVAGYHNDDPFGERRTLLRYRHLLPALPFYQGFHVYRPVNLQEARAHGVAAVDLLLPYFIPWLDYPRPLDAAQRQVWGCEVVFAGHMEQDGRLEILIEAVRQGIHLRIHGGERYWRAALPADIYRRVGPCRHLGVEAYRQALCAARIGACFFSRNNRDQYTRRSFEIPACGLFLLSERTPWMEQLFKAGEEADFFSSAEEFVEKIKFYLHNERVRERIAAAGRRKVIQDGHDIHSRMRQWLRTVDAWRAGAQ
ncbi:MAG: glycosyltransferase family 1 protein [Magnetococcales bacterium]|nr:glycosyltransferase family 1 protein [Magnetococcales bacterium]